MQRLSTVIALMTLLWPGVVCAEEVIAFRELESYSYIDGKMERFEGRFESVYSMEGDAITRLQVTDLKNNETHHDKTTFYIDRKLRSDPTKRPAIQVKPVIRAIGRFGIDGIEILSITDQFLVSVKSTSDCFEISRSKRVK